MAYNTAVSALMILTNTYYELDNISKDDYRVLLTLLNPMAPHITEELNEMIGFEPIANSTWPEYDESKLVEDTIKLPIQVNGKVRDVINIALDLDEAKVKEAVHSSEAIKTHLDGKNIVKEIYVKNKIYNIVVK